MFLKNHLPRILVRHGSRHRERNVFECPSPEWWRSAWVHRESFLTRKDVALKNDVRRRGDGRGTRAKPGRRGRTHRGGFPRTSLPSAKGRGFLVRCSGAGGPVARSVSLERANVPWGQARIRTSGSFWERGGHGLRRCGEPPTPISRKRVTGNYRDESKNGGSRAGNGVLRPQVERICPVFGV